MPGTPDIPRLVRAVLLAWPMALGVHPALTAQPAASRKPAPLPEIVGGQRVLQALNRFTFGPRPGDVESVEAVGLDRWFERQLNPATIDDSALNARLTRYPAMSLTVSELEARFPGPPILKQIIAGKLPLPADPAGRQMVEEQIGLYKLQQERKAEKKAGAESPPDPIPHEAILKMAALAPAARMQALLTLAPADLIRLRQGLKGADADAFRQSLTPDQLETFEALGGSGRMMTAEASETRLLRDLYSERQLEAVMTDFWLNHFNVYDRKNENQPWLIPGYERETIRAHALGRFEDLLVATAESPAMLEYLDNARSIGAGSPAALRQKKAAGLNENYGRELMELHTLGVNGGYTQADVTEVAKVFTGWTVERPDQEEGGGFQFDPRRHEPGARLVLGQRIAAGGMEQGLAVLHVLANSPATAHFVSLQLAVRFVADDPPPALVDRMAASFLKSHGDIRQVLRTLWQSPELWSTETCHGKFKTPLEFVVSTVRASGAEVANPAGLVESLNKLGMPLYGMQTPQGYSWKQADWVNTGALVSRMNFALVLSGNRVGGTRLDLGSLLRASPTGMTAIESSAHDMAEAKEFRLESTLMSEPVSARTRAAVLGQVNGQADGQAMTEQAVMQFDLRGAGGGQGDRGKRGARPGPPPDDPQAAVMAGLLLGSPEFQRR